MNFYKRYLGAYAKKTAHLSLTEHGAYQVLLDTYYSTGKPLPASKDELHRICRAMTAAERKAVGKVSDEFFPVNGDGRRHNERADEELTTYETQAETNRRIAVEREAKRKGHEQSTNRATNHDTKGEPNSEVRSQKELQNLSPPPAGFIEFWNLWPSHFRKQSRGKCETVWRRKKLSARADEILSHVQSLIGSSQWADSQFIPAPLVYLNEERWDGAELALSAVQVDA